MFLRFTLLIVAFFAITTKVFADPWFTGPLLAPAGKTIPLGHANLEVYGFYTENLGIYTRSWKLDRTPSGENTQINPIFSYGLTDNLDFQFSIPYGINNQSHHVGRHIGEATALLGYQLINQDKSLWIPNLRIAVQQIFPTGRYEDINPVNLGTDGSGLGSYQTALSLNFQHLLNLGNWLGAEHYLRTRFSMAGLYAHPVRIRGITVFGGANTTNGQMDPGSLVSFDLAGEFTINQNWVAVMEGFFFSREAAKFRGFPGLSSTGQRLRLGKGSVEELSVAPAIEYNFSANYGLIAGVWFSSMGKDAPDFYSTIVAFNAYF